MKHLKKFEYFGYQEEKQPEEEFLMDDPFKGEEEDRFEFDEEELDLDMPDTFEEEEEEGYVPPTQEEGEEMGEGPHGRISSFHKFQESTCPSCNCNNCDCGSEETYEAKKADKMTKKEKELAAKYPPKDKITRGDIITAAKENADKKKGGKEDKKEDKKEEKDSKSPKGKLSKAQEKLPPALKKAIASGVRD
jgi:hypothetical protein